MQIFPLLKKERGKNIFPNDSDHLRNCVNHVYSQLDATVSMVRPGVWYAAHTVVAVPLEQIFNYRQKVLKVIIPNFEQDENKMR